MSEEVARRQWAAHVREALDALPSLEAHLVGLGSEEGRVGAWIKALCVADVLLVEEAEALGRVEVGLDAPAPLRHRQCRGGRRWE